MFLPQHRFRRHLGAQFAPTWVVESGQERPKSGQETLKRTPRASQSGPRMIQERPRAPQEWPKSKPRAAKSSQRATQSDPRAAKRGPRATQNNEDGLKSSPEGPKTAPNPPKGAPRLPKPFPDPLKCTQSGSKIGAKALKLALRHLRRIARFKFLASFRVSVRISLGSRNRCLRVSQAQIHTHKNRPDHSPKHPKRPQEFPNNPKDSRVSPRINSSQPQPAHRTPLARGRRCSARRAF